MDPFTSGAMQSTQDNTDVKQGAVEQQFFWRTERVPVADQVASCRGTCVGYDRTADGCILVVEHVQNLLLSLKEQNDSAHLFQLST